MTSRRQLARELERVEGFADPRLELEQYATPAEVAASIVHEADLRGDLERPVVDLGAGTGMLAVGAALRGAAPVVGLDLDASALRRLRANADRLDAGVQAVAGDVDARPLCPTDPVTVLMNPPFGAQRGRRGADRPFLEAAAAVAAVSYSVHNAGSRAFLEAVVGDLGGEITHRYRATVRLPRRFGHHTSATAEVAADVVRVRWG